MRGHVQTAQSIDVLGPQLMRKSGYRAHPVELAGDLSGIVPCMVAAVGRHASLTYISFNPTTRLWAGIGYILPGSVTTLNCSRDSCSDGHTCCELRLQSHVHIDGRQMAP